MGGCNCNRTDDTLLSWVAGNDVLLLARVYEKVLDAGTVEDVAFDLTACDDIEVSVTGSISRIVLPKKEDGVPGGAWEIAQDEDNCLAVLIPHELPQDEYACEIACKRNGYHVRSFEFAFRIVETNCDARTTFEVVDGCQSASVRVSLQIVPQAFVRGQNSYEAWKELPGNEDKTLQEYIDEVLDLNGLTGRLAASEQQRQLAEGGRRASETNREEAEAERRTVFAADHEQAEADHATALSDHSTALGDHQTSVSDHAALDAAVAAANGAAANAEAKATEAGRVNATLSGTVLTVTNRNGVSQSVNVKGSDGRGVPAGGSTGQVLAKKSGSDYDTEWVEQGSSDVDTELDSTSTNPVQNKVITSALQGKANVGDIPDVSALYSKPVGGIPKTDLASDVQTSLGRADTALQSFTETDPTVPSWAKQSSKPSYSYSEITDKPADLAHIGDAQGSATIADFDPETDTVHITAQVLSSAAKAQARENIGAGTSNFSGSYNDLSDKPTIPTVPSNIVVGGTQGYTIAVVSSMPASPDANTIYLVTGS